MRLIGLFNYGISNTLSSLRILIEMFTIVVYYGMPAMPLSPNTTVVGGSFSTALKGIAIRTLNRFGRR